MTWLLLLAGAWIVCGVASYFVQRAEWRLLGMNWPVNHRHKARVAALLGPISLLVSLFLYAETRKEYGRRQALQKRDRQNACCQRVGKLLALAAVLGLASSALAGDYGYSHRGCYGYSYNYGHADYSYSYHAAQWWHGKYYEAGYYYWHPGGYWYKQGYGPHYGHDYEYKVKVVHKEVEPDYYASVRDYYRDSLLADAIAYRVLTAKATPPAPPATLPDYGAPPRTAPRAGAPAGAPAPAVSANTPVPAALKDYVAQSCLKCHNGLGGKGGVDLSRLESAPAGLRWACHGVVVSGEMPQGGPEAPEAILKEFYDWAKAGTKATRAARAERERSEPTKQPQPPKETRHESEALATRGPDRDPARKRK